jgi:hypothetical protein
MVSGSIERIEVPNELPEMSGFATRSSVKVNLKMRSGRETSIELDPISFLDLDCDRPMFMSFFKWMLREKNIYIDDIE